MAAQLSEKYGVEVKTIAADFSETYESGLYTRIGEELGDTPVAVLVNNVGMSYPSALYFHELAEYPETEDLAQQLIDLNVASVTHMTGLVLPGMVARKRGVILNISSAAGRVPIGNPMYAGYSAAKAYVDFFSRSIAVEVASKGVVVQCQAPYFVTTKLAKIRHASMTVPTPDKFVAASLARLGEGSSIVPYPTHAVQDALVQSLPHFLLSKNLMAMHRGLRSRWLKKRAGNSDTKKTK